MLIDSHRALRFDALIARVVLCAMLPHSLIQRYKDAGTFRYEENKIEMHMQSGHFMNLLLG